MVTIDEANRKFFSIKLSKASGAVAVKVKMWVDRLPRMQEKGKDTYMKIVVAFVEY